MEDNRILWEEDRFDSKHIIRSGLIVFTLYSLIFLVALVTDIRVSLDEGSLIFYLIFYIIFMCIIVVPFFYFMTLKKQFHVKFTTAKLYIRTVFVNKTFKLNDLEQIEIILKKRKNFSIKRKRSPRNYYNQIKTTFKIHFLLNNESKKYSILARFFASSRDYGKEARRIAEQKRIDFEEKLKKLEKIFPELIKIVDSELNHEISNLNKL